MEENKFIVTDATDVMCIGGYGNDLGNKGLLKYSEEEIAKMVIENNNTTDNTRLANSLLRTIRNQDNIINGMEKFFKYAYDNEVRPLNDRKVSVWTICLDKLQELKGDNKEC